MTLLRTRVADYFHQRGLSGAGLRQETSRVLGGFVTLESIAHGFRSGLRFLSLMMLGIGLVVAIFDGRIKTRGWRTRHTGHVRHPRHVRHAWHVVLVWIGL